MATNWFYHKLIIPSKRKTTAPRYDTCSFRFFSCSSPKNDAMKMRAGLFSFILMVPLAWLSVLRGQEPPGDGKTAESGPVEQVPLPPGVTVQKDIANAPGAGVSHLLDLYLPPPSGQAVPVMVFIHGGGWRGGSKDGCPAKFWHNTAMRWPASTIA
jgi:acetyl esterase/lipase